MSQRRARALPALFALSIVAVVCAAILAIGLVGPRSRAFAATMPAAAAGGQHSCALIDDGTIACWGDNGGGQLGDGTNVDSTVPVAVDGITDAVAITTGDSHSCAILASGSAMCWGANGSGQLGDGTNGSTNSPVEVVGLSSITSITAGYAHTCALAAGIAYCWGENTYGQLGDGTTDTASTPVAVVGLTGVSSISAAWDHTCPESARPLRPPLTLIPFWAAGTIDTRLAWQPRTDLASPHTDTAHPGRCESRASARMGALTPRHRDETAGDRSRLD